MPDRPGYMARTEPLNKAGVMNTPASGTDVFSVEPGTPSLPMLEGRCAPRPLNANTLTRITTAGVEVPLASLNVPNGAEYNEFEIQWWCDYPLLVELGFIQVYFRNAGGGEQDVYVPFPTMYPARFCREYGRGEQINVFARLTPGFPVSGATGTPIYIGCAIQLGYQRSQMATLALKGTDLCPMGTKRATVIVPPGGALVNPFLTPSLVATRVRAFWNVNVPGVPAAGAIAVSSLSEGGGPQAVNLIDQGLAINLAFNNSTELKLGDMREFLIGNPAPLAPLLAPAAVVVEWDQWRVR